MPPSARTPSVAVLLAVCNGEPFLRQALDSLFTQTFTDFELIVVDDGSTDGTGEILRSCTDPRLRVLANPRNIGLTKSLNRAAAASRAPLLARHDADDLSHPDRLASQVARLAAQPAVVLLATAYELVDERGAVLGVSVPPSEDGAIRARLAVGNAFCHGTVMMRRDAFEAVGGYCEAFPVTQDYDLWLRLAERGRLMSLDRPLYQFRFHAQSVSRNRRELQLAYGALARSLAAARRDRQPEPAIPRDVLDAYPVDPRRLVRDFREAAVLHYIAGHRSAALEVLTRAEALGAAADTSGVTWRDWILRAAHRVALATGSVEAGRRFLDLAASVLRLEHAAADRARYYADQAAIAGERDGWRYTYKAVTAHPRFLFNRDLWTTRVRRLLGRRTRAASLPSVRGA